MNGQQVVLDQSLTCKVKNVIYIAQCSVCAAEKEQKEDTYFGQTTTEARQRFNGHRGKFKVDNELSYTKSALAQHCFNEHPEQMDLKLFKLGLVKRCAAMQLDREEHRFISKFRTDVYGINRIKVVK